MKILIIGATGGVGTKLVKQALEKRHEVTILVRKPETVKIENANLKIIEGSVTDENAVREAVAGQEAVCTAIGISPTFKKVTVHSEGAKIVVKAMREKGIKRLLSITGIGAGDSRGHGGFFYDKIFQPILLGTIYADKDREEAIIKASNLDWTIVRPLMLTGGELTGKYRALNDWSDVHGGKIARADVADFMLKELENNKFVRRTPLLLY